MALDRLPDELLLDVFEYLPERDLEALVYTSKHLRGVACDTKSSTVRLNVSADRSRHTGPWTRVRHARHVFFHTPSVDMSIISDNLVFLGNAVIGSSLKSLVADELCHLDDTVSKTFRKKLLPQFTSLSTLVVPSRVIPQAGLTDGKRFSRVGIHFELVPKQMGARIRNPVENLFSWPAADFQTMYDFLERAASVCAVHLFGEKAAILSIEKLLRNFKLKVGTDKWSTIRIVSLLDICPWTAFSVRNGLRIQLLTDLTIIGCPNTLEWLKTVTSDHSVLNLVSLTFVGMVAEKKSSKRKHDLDDKEVAAMHTLISICPRLANLHIDIPYIFARNRMMAEEMVGNAVHGLESLAILSEATSPDLGELRSIVQNAPNLKTVAFHTDSATDSFRQKMVTAGFENDLIEIKDIVKATPSLTRLIIVARPSSREAQEDEAVYRKIAVALEKALRSGGDSIDHSITMVTVMVRQSGWLTGRLIEEPWHFSILAPGKLKRESGKGLFGSLHKSTFSARVNGCV